MLKIVLLAISCKLVFGAPCIFHTAMKRSLGGCLVSVSTAFEISQLIMLSLLLTKCPCLSPTLTNILQYSDIASFTTESVSRLLGGSIILNNTQQNCNKINVVFKRNVFLRLSWSSSFCTCRDRITHEPSSPYLTG